MVKVHPNQTLPTVDGGNLTFPESLTRKTDEARFVRPNGLSWVSWFEKQVQIQEFRAKTTLLNFLKGMIGPGCLSLPLAFKGAGLWMGLFLVIFYGFLNNFCMVQLVRCAQFLSRKKGDAFLDYGSVVFEACSNSFQWIRPHRHLGRIIVNSFIIALQIGVCSVFYVFVGVHTAEIVEYYWNPGFSKQIYMLLVLVPFILVNFLRTLKVIAVISTIGNLLILASLVFIFQHLIRQSHDFNLPWITDFEGIMAATGSILYSFEGQAMVLPMENKLKNPERMVGKFGVLSCGMFLVTFVYCCCGFLGYVTYGSAVEGSITLNLPDQPQFMVVKILLIFVVFFGFVIQQYVVVEMTWPRVKSTVSKTFKNNHVLGFELVFRAFLVILAMLFAVAIPNLEKIIPLVGVTCGMMLAFVFPAVIDTVTFLPKMLKKLQTSNLDAKNSLKLRIAWRMIQNFFLVCLGTFGSIAGLQSSVKDLVD